MAAPTPLSDPDPAASPAGAGFGPASGAPVQAAAEAPPQEAAADATLREAGGSVPLRKGPLSFLSGALTSGLLAWLCLGLSQRVVTYYGEHPPHYSAQIAQSIATALKTLIVGMCFLATFSFAFIGIGLALTFVRSLLQRRDAEGTS